MGLPVALFTVAVEVAAPGILAAIVIDEAGPWLILIVTGWVAPRIFEVTCDNSATLSPGLTFAEGLGAGSEAGFAPFGTARTNSVTV